jgi:transposase
MKNRYCKRSRLSEAKFRQLLRCFCDDLDTLATARVVNISREHITRYYGALRLRIYQLTNQEDNLSGEIEIDESYFGAKRIRGRRGRGAKGKIPVIGLLKRGGRVYTTVVNSCSRKDLLPIIKGKILEESTIYTDGWKSYDGLVLNGYRHYRIYHSKNEFARGKNHINGIESFWSYAKRRMAKQNGVKRDKFVLHLKESEFRWNYRNNDMYKLLLNELKKRPLRL